MRSFRVYLGTFVLFLAIGIAGVYGLGKSWFVNYELWVVSFGAFIVSLLGLAGTFVWVVWDFVLYLKRKS